MPLIPLLVPAAGQAQLLIGSERPRMAQTLTMRSRVVVLAAHGKRSRAIAAQLTVPLQTAGKPQASLPLSQRWRPRSYAYQLICVCGSADEHSCRRSGPAFHSPLSDESLSLEIGPNMSADPLLTCRSRTA